MQHFVKESRIAAPPRVVFAFHEQPDALVRLIPPWERVEVVEPARSLVPGSRARLRLRVGPLRFDWVAEITECVRDRLFVDRQVEGPFSSWRHRHGFEEDRSGGTILRDEIDFSGPFGPVVELLTGRFTKSRLHRMFDFRHEVTRRACEAGPVQG
jgi:ligand-binding SRPBCC domain-containing protein